MVHEIRDQEGDPDESASTMPASVMSPTVAPATIVPSEPKSAGVEMSFLDHLEELRWRILKSLAAILIGAVICFVFSDALMVILTYPYKQAVLGLEAERPSGAIAAIEQLLRNWMGDSQAAPPEPVQGDLPSLPPARQLQSLKPLTYFLVTLQVSLLGGVVLALPMLVHQEWLFIAPGLLTREKHLLIPTVLFSVLCFVIGALVAYW